MKHFIFQQEAALVVGQHVLDGAIVRQHVLDGAIVRQHVLDGAIVRQAGRQMLFTG
jgi:hypothetical protein